MLSATSCSQLPPGAVCISTLCRHTSGYQCSSLPCCSTTSAVGDVVILSFPFKYEMRNLAACGMNRDFSYAHHGSFPSWLCCSFELFQRDVGPQVTRSEFVLLWATYLAIMYGGLEAGIGAGIVFATLYFAFAYARVRLQCHFVASGI